MIYTRVLCLIFLQYNIYRMLENYHWNLRHMFLMYLKTQKNSLEFNQKYACSWRIYRKIFIHKLYIMQLVLSRRWWCNQIIFYWKVFLNFKDIFNLFLSLHSFNINQFHCTHALSNIDMINRMSPCVFVTFFFEKMDKRWHNVKTIIL